MSNLLRLARKIKKKAKNYFYNDKIVKNFYKKSNDKTVLISYITHPFIMGHSFSHTNYFEALSIAKVFDELNYNVDIINYNFKRKIQLDKYAAIFGFGEIFERYFRLDKIGTKSIYYGTGMNVSHQNNATLNRVYDVFIKKGHYIIESSRYVDKSWTFQTTLVDGMVVLGNDVCKNSYKKFYKGKIFNIGAPFYKVCYYDDILQNKKIDSNKRFLWFGGAGFIHKGLDLLLDYFSTRKDIELHICGDFNTEKKFKDVYKNELQQKNIILHGFVQVESPQFVEILKLCDYIIYPSCSEGGSPSVLNVIGNGGLIPIITRETTINTGDEIWIHGYDFKSIDRAIKKALEIDQKKKIEMQKRNAEYVLNNNSQHCYVRNLKSSILEILI